MTPTYTTAADEFGGWQDNLLTGTPPTLYPIGSGELERVGCGPGLVTLFGGPPGAGKTGFTMQATVDALRLTSSLRTLVANVEMSPRALLDRQLARLAGIPADLIRSRKLEDSHAERLQTGLATIDSIADRLAFVRPPFTLDNVAAAADEFDAGLLLLDYVQRIRPPGDHGDQRNAVNAMMDYLRKFADAGLAVIVIAAVGRTKDAKGRSSYDAEGLGLASFRESSELEFGADDAYILAPVKDHDERVALRHLKSRHGATRDIALLFDKPFQSFTPVNEPDTTTANTELAAAIAGLWDQTTPSSDDEEAPNDDAS
jgi:replicative DNA helicase